MRRLVKKMTAVLGVIAMVLFASMVIMAVPAFAGADATFGPLNTLLTGWMQGSLGTLLGLIAGAIGLGSAMAGRWGYMFTGFGVAAGSFYLPTVIPTITTGLM